MPFSNDYKSPLIGTLTGDEADRLIDRMQFPRYDSHHPNYVHNESPLAFGGFAAGVVVDGGTPTKPHVRFDTATARGVYCCLASEPVYSGQAVSIDADGCVKPISGKLHFNINTDFLYEGFDEADSGQHPSTVVKTNITCSYCQAKGLHWSGKKGVNLKLRDENGFVHDCGRSKVTISL